MKNIFCQINGNEAMLIHDGCSSYLTELEETSLAHCDAVYQGGVHLITHKYYVEMRHKLDAEANNIFCMTSMLTLLDRHGDDTIEIDPVALGKINQMLN